ncbi:MAG: ISKra4 family transposase [Acidimicrobiaceae bacterium]|nr:ISKra4 family transposase [Acidimicrobiaceae bacterium]
MNVASLEVFSSPRGTFEAIVHWLEGAEAAALSHGDLEAQLESRGRELLRQLFQSQLDLRALSEARIEVTCAEGVAHAALEPGHRRALGTIFGEVIVERLAYRHRGHANCYPADGSLNLPRERHSHGLRRLAALEASRGSFEEASAAITRFSGQKIAKRQVEALTARSAVDVEDFYRRRAHEPANVSDVLVISADGKGIVMRPASLRPATAAKAAAACHKLTGRLSKGEKRNRKRLAEVGAVYDLAPVARTPADVLASRHNDDTAAPPAPRAKAKWVTASVVDDAASVIATVFDEAERHDPEHRRRWVGLVDGNNHQIERIRAEAKARGIDVFIVVDLIHVLEYLWGAAWCFFAEGDPAVEAWVHDRALAVLEGTARDVAAGIRRRATAAKLSKDKRLKADACATYLVNKADYLDYPTALAQGWPIASGVIEGTCRYLVADRMDITGARWSVEGAEAVLKLRAVRANGDFQDYWRFHLDEERHRIHETRYADQTIPIAA